MRGTPWSIGTKGKVQRRKRRGGGGGRGRVKVHGVDALGTKRRVED